MLSRRNYESAYERLRLKLKATRLEAGLTQAEVARMLGRTQSFISKVETRRRRVDFLELQCWQRSTASRLLTTSTHPLRSCSPNSS